MSKLEINVVKAQTHNLSVVLCLVCLLNQVKYVLSLPLVPKTTQLVLHTSGRFIALLLAPIQQTKSVQETKNKHNRTETKHCTNKCK